MKDWNKVKLGTLLTESKVISATPNADNRIRVKLNVLGIEKRPITKDKKGATKYYIRKEGQFVYGKQNLHKGAFGIIPKELDGFESSQDIPAFDINDSCYPEWIFYFFLKNNFYLKLESLAKGVGSKRIQPKQIFDLDIYLPPKNEQKTIIDKIKEVEINNKKLIQEIKLQRKNLTLIKKSIIQEAIEGRLTRDWRLNNVPDESAISLLDRIKDRKKQLVKEKKIKKEISTSTITENEIPFQIPETWEWCRIQDISEKLGAGSTPKGGKSVYISEGIMFFRSQNIHNEGLFLDDVVFITNEVHERMKGTKVFAKDILLNITGGSIGRSTLIDDDFETANVSQHVAIVRMIELDTRQYVHNVIISPYFKEKIMEVQVGVSREGLSMTSLKKLLIPLPSIAEQNVIIEKINQFQLNFNLLEQDIISSIENAEKLMGSFLSELLGDENNLLTNTNAIKKPNKADIREIMYNSKTTVMDLVEVLQKNGKLHAEDLWKMSKFPDDIDSFYAELKKQIEIVKSIKESSEKGYLELI